VSQAPANGQSIFLKGRGLLDLAIHIEESGRQAYEYFESRARDKKLKSLWALLKDEETAHAGYFKGLQRSLPEDEAQRASTAGSEAFVRALASSYVFTERRLAKVLLEDLRSELDAIAYGIFIEKESILTYITLKDHVPPRDIPVIDRIIAEEKRHLAKLLAMGGLERGLETPWKGFSDEKHIS
jgi:rubrerythrin